MLFGAAIVSRTNPVIGLPLALASHFVLDAIPHYDGVYPHRPYQVLPILQLLLDLLLGILLLSKLTASRADQTYLFLGALLAILPDIQVGLYLNYHLFAFLKPIVSWHIRIQKYRPPAPVGMLTTLAVTLISAWMILS
jgi:hypothetical protein